MGERGSPFLGGPANLEVRCARHPHPKQRAPCRDRRRHASDNKTCHLSGQKSSLVVTWASEDSVCLPFAHPGQRHCEVGVVRDVPCRTAAGWQSGDWAPPHACGTPNALACPHRYRPPQRHGGQPFPNCGRPPPQADLPRWPPKGLPASSPSSLHPGTLRVFPSKYGPVHSAPGFNPRGGGGAVPVTVRMNSRILIPAFRLVTGHKLPPPHETHLLPDPSRLLRPLTGSFQGSQSPLSLRSFSVGAASSPGTATPPLNLVNS